MLVKAVGNMYEWLTHEWRPITGKCPHGCKYCYVTAIQNRYGNTQTIPKFHEAELRCNLGEGNFIFVCSTFDLFAEGISEEWIKKILTHCRGYPKNKYLFQTKNPQRMYELKELLPAKSVLATTIETDKLYPGLSQAPSVIARALFIGQLSTEFETCVTIEPILKFDLDKMIQLIRVAKPKFVNIGADSKKTDLDEPSREEVNALIIELKKYTEVRKKVNLERLQ